jgi:transcriptional regulator with XRE-family HTH domain
MKGGEVIREARKRAGISQTELARRLGTKQPVIARWESGSRSPAFADVVRGVRACGLKLDIAIGAEDPGEDALIAQWLRLTPKECLERNLRMLETERWASRAETVSSSRT